MNEKTKTTNAATGLVMFRINYQWANNRGQLRNGTCVVEAKDIIEAQKIAPERVRSFGIDTYRITKVVEF